MRLISARGVGLAVASKDVNRLGLGEPSTPNDVAVPSNWDGEHILKVHMEFATGARLDQSQRILLNVTLDDVIACLRWQ